MNDVIYVLSAVDITMASSITNAPTWFEIEQAKGWGSDRVQQHAIPVDHLLDITPFARLAMKVKESKGRG